MTKKIIMMLLCAAVLAGAADIPPVDTLLKKLEFNNSMTTDIQSRVALVQQKPGQGVKNIEAMYYRRDRDNAFLIVMMAPEAEKGNGYLRVDDNFWMYRRNTRTFQHINRDENIGGSNAKGGDFESRPLTEMYEGLKTTDGRDSVSREMLGQIPVYKFPIKARVRDVDYPRKTVYLRTDNFLQLKEESYAVSGTLMQTSYYLKYSEINGRFVPVKQLFVDEFEKGNKTMVDLSAIATEKLDDKIFTKAYLESLSK